MNQKFLLRKIKICELKLNEDNSIIPDSRYPERICVIDKDNKIAIDLDLKLKYDYIETKSNLYFFSKSLDKIKQHERVAIQPLIFPLLTEEDYVNALDIISKIENGEQFPDGNEVYNNEEYLKLLNEKQKTKKLNKIK